MGNDNVIFINQGMGKEYGIFLNKGKKETIGMKNEEVDRTVAAGQAHMISMLGNLLKKRSTRNVGQDVFDGNWLEYHNFMTRFMNKQTNELMTLGGD